MKTIPDFKEGNFITGKNICACMQHIYDLIGLNATAKVTDLEEYAVLKDTRMRINGKQVRGYIIQYIRIK